MATLLSVSVAGFAQREKEKDEEETKGFKKENLFTGGNLTVSFFNRTTILGGSPVFGYKIASFLDGGVVLNYTYSGRKDYQEINDKVRQSVYGGGLFTRLYPANFLFLQGQFEHNFTKLTYTAAPGSLQYLSSKDKVEANSFLVGAGYTSGRDPHNNNTFYYLSVLFDVIKNRNSPYVDLVYNPNTGDYLVRTLPIIRAGLNIALFQGQYGNGRGR